MAAPGRLHLVAESSSRQLIAKESNVGMGATSSALNKPNHFFDMLTILGCLLTRHFSLKLSYKDRQLCLVKCRITANIDEPKTDRF